jgi:hypothetical protein
MPLLGRRRYILILDIFRLNEAAIIEVGSTVENRYTAWAALLLSLRRSGLRTKVRVCD